MVARPMPVAAGLGPGAGSAPGVELLMMVGAGQPGRGPLRGGGWRGALLRGRGRAGRTFNDTNTSLHCAFKLAGRAGRAGGSVARCAALYAVVPHRAVVP